MVSKKLKSLFTLCLLVSAGAFAQTETTNGGYMTGGYSIYDSSVISSKRMAQQNEFLNNSYAFPAKPRNQFEFGLSLGLLNVSGDVPTKVLTAPNFAVHVRKALGYLFSLRLQYLYGDAEGFNYKGALNYGKNTPWTNAGYFAPTRSANGQIVNINAAGGISGNTDVVYYNYRTNIQDLSLQGLVTLTNIKFHKARTNLQLYVGGGAGATIFKSKVNALREGGTGGTQNYAAIFNSVPSKFPGRPYENRKEIRDFLEENMDNTFESEAQNRQSLNPILRGYTLKPSATAIVGLAFRLGKRINLALEDRFTAIKSDVLDGQQWQEHPYGDAATTGDQDTYNYLSLGLNFNLGSKRVEPLYWLNPLDYAYSELNTPKHMRLPKPTFEDADGDGVLDQLDREPNTPAGCPVDTHGVTKDTDGDGVPDCKDKQLITPTECQPVNADGVGRCPDPACCTTITPGGLQAPTAGCPTDYPSLSFRGSAMSNDNRAMLSTVASKMKSNPNCNISITGYPEASKAAQAVCNTRNESIRRYLVESQGISADRISINCEVGDGTNKNTVDIRSN